MDSDFVSRVLGTFNGIDLSRDCLFWLISGENVKFFVRCDDFFGPAEDLQEITPANFQLLIIAKRQCAASAEEAVVCAWAPLLFCYLAREMDPQESIFSIMPPEIHHLFRQFDWDSKSTMNPAGATGIQSEPWTCPVCNRGCAPHVDTCDHGAQNP